MTVAYGLGPHPRPHAHGPEGRNHFVIPRGESRSFPPPQPLLPAGRPRASPCNPRPPGRSLGCRARGPVARRCGILPASICPASICTSPAGCSCRPGAGYGRWGWPPAPFSLSVRSLPPSILPRGPPMPTAVAGRGAGTCAWCVSAGKKKFPPPAVVLVEAGEGPQRVPVAKVARQRSGVGKTGRDAFGTLGLQSQEFLPRCLLRPREGPWQGPRQGRPRNSRLYFPRAGKSRTRTRKGAGFKPKGSITERKETQKLFAKAVVGTSPRWSPTASPRTPQPGYAAAQPAPSAPHACARPLTPRGDFGPGPGRGGCRGAALPARLSL